MNFRGILKRITANMDAASEAFVRETTDEPLHLAFLPTPEEQAGAKARKAGGYRNRRGPTEITPFDPDMDPVERARTEPRSKRADAARAYRRSQRGTGSYPRRPGPLEADYDPSAVSPRLRAAGRIVQLIVKMQPLYVSGDRAAFDLLVPEFDWLSDLLDEPGWGVVCRMQLFPDFVSEEDMARA